MQIIQNRKIFDFFIEIIKPDIPCVIWSEYDSENDEEVTIFSSIYKSGKWKDSKLVYIGKFTYPNIKITSGYNNKMHILLARKRGSKDDLNLITYDGTEWNPVKKIRDIKNRTFGYSIAASKFKQEIYVVFGDYRERHFFPYILTAPFSGHICKDFGKLFMIKGDGVSWGKSMRITDNGKFSCKQSSIFLNQQSDILHIVWVDHRHGFRERAIYYDSFIKGMFCNNVKVSQNNQMLFSPFVSCDREDNIQIAWSIIDRDSLGKLCYRERRRGRWQDVVELSNKGLINDMTVDLSGNVHIVWDDEHHVYYQTKMGERWGDARTLDGKMAKVGIDERNDVHLVILRRRNNGQDSLVYNPSSLV